MRNLLLASARIRGRAASASGRTRHYVRRSLEPVRAARSILRALWNSGRPAARSGAPSIAAQAAQLSWLWMRHGVPADLYYYYRLYRPSIRGQAGRFIVFGVHKAITDAIIDARHVDRATLDDKRMFERICRTHGIATPPVLASFTAGRVDWMKELPPADLFSKPTAGSMGRDTAIWRREAPGWSSDGLRLDQAGLRDELSRRSLSMPQILQPRVENDEAIRALGCGGVCTARVVTIRFPDAPAEHLRSVFRMTTHGSPADNFAAGGMAAPVDALTGVIGPAVRKGSAERFERHPDTGATIPGTVLPRWGEVLALCLRAHDEAFRDFPGVGWDVAITPAGPWLMEGNHDWDLKLMQQPHDEPLGSTRLPACYLAHLAALGMDRD